METSTTIQEMVGYLNQLSEPEKRTFLDLIKTFLIKRNGGLNIQSLEDYTRELEKADAEIEAGDFIMHEDVVKYFSKK